MAAIKIENHKYQPNYQHFYKTQNKTYLTCENTSVSPIQIKHWQSYAPLKNENIGNLKKKSSL